MDVTPWTKQGITSLCQVFLGTVAGTFKFLYGSLPAKYLFNVETIAFHGGIIVACCLLMKVTDILQSKFYSNPSTISNIRREFRYHPSKPSEISADD